MIRLKFLRLERQLSQRQLAAATNDVVPQSELSRIESGRTVATEKELKALASVLGCHPDRLFDHVNDPGSGLEWRVDGPYRDQP